MVFSIYDEGEPKRLAMSLATDSLRTDEEWAQLGRYLSEVLRGVSAGRTLDDASGGFETPVRFRD